MKPDSKGFHDLTPSAVRALFHQQRPITLAPSERMRAAAMPVANHQLGVDEPVESHEVGTGADYSRAKGALQQRFLREISRMNLLSSNNAEIAVAVREFASRMLADESLALTLNEEERARLAEDLTEETLGLGPLSAFMSDPTVTDILVNAPDRIYVERFGRLELTSARFVSREHMTRVIERIAARMGRRIDNTSPMVDLRLPDGSRVNATLPPATIDGPTISIRRFGRRRLRRKDLLEFGSLSAGMYVFLEIAIRMRLNILISGGTGAGKSTLLGALAEAIPDSERIVTIEDTAELTLDQTHVIRMEARPSNVEGEGRISARDLLVNSLRMRPDRVIIGEVRGGEALDMLQAMNTGHDGSLTTIHANSTRDALSRLETLVLMSDLGLPSQAIREQISSAIHLVIHVRRYEDGVRRVEAISEICGLEGRTPLIQDIFIFRRKGLLESRVEGSFVATGIVPRFVPEWRSRGIELPVDMFRSAQ